MIVDRQRRALLTWLCVMLAAVAIATPVQVPPGSRNYGLDGPWTSLRILVGQDYEREAFDPDRYDAFDVFPGGWLATILPTIGMCAADPLCGVGGQLNPNDDIPDALRTTWAPDYRQRFNGGGNMKMTGPMRPQPLAIPGISTEATARNTIPDAGIVALTSGNYIVGNDVSRGPVELGYLTLGGSDNWTIDYESDVVTYWPPGSWLAKQNIITSNSFGLHVGSAAFNYSASMFYGGYDRGRTIGPVVEYGKNPAYLQDIIIGIEIGDSPFAFNETQTGLLVNGQSVRTSVPVSFQPIDSYIALPRQTCDKIASLLPVTYDSTLNLYLWNVYETRYRDVVSSPAYLGFVFPASGGTSQEVVIKVPFALLNLALQPEYSGRQSVLSYFPCQPYVLEGEIAPQDEWPTEGTYVLGKAFLQAAFFGRDWENDRGWIAQAPGPGASGKGLGEDIRDINREDTEIDTNSDLGLFASSWSEHWTPLGGALSNNASNTDRGDASLPVGSKAGIGAAVGVAALSLIFAALFFIRRRQKASRSQKVQEPWNMQEVQIVNSDHKGTTYYPLAAVEAPSWTLGPRELAVQDERQELAGQDKRQELAGQERRQELE